jgi:hypothetical protein
MEVADYLIPKAEVAAGVGVGKLRTGEEAEHVEPVPAAVRAAWGWAKVGHGLAK